MDINSLPPAKIIQNLAGKFSVVPKNIANAPLAAPIENQGVINEGPSSENVKFLQQAEYVDPITSDEYYDANTNIAVAGFQFLKSLEATMDTYDKGLDEVRVKDPALAFKDWDLAVEDSQLVVTGEDLTNDEKDIILAAFNDQGFKNDLKLMQESIISMSEQSVLSEPINGSVTHFDLNKDNISEVFSFRESVANMKNKTYYNLQGDLQSQMLDRGGDYLKEDAQKLRFVEVDI